MKRLLRSLFLLHLRRPALLWTLTGLLTVLLGLGVLRVEKRLDLMSLLPTEHPVVKASIEAGVGQQEILWLCAEGSAKDLEARQAWAEALVERLLDGTDAPRGDRLDSLGDTLPLNGMGGEGRIAAPSPVPGPKGVSLWPALLAAGSFLDGDPEVGRLVTEQFYGLSPLLLGDHLAPLARFDELERRFQETARRLRSPDPVQARMAALDPLNLLSFIPADDPTISRMKRSSKAFPLKLRTGYLETLDGRFVLAPFMLDFPSGDTASTARVLAWLGNGARGPFPAKASLAQVESAMQRGQTEGDLQIRAFPIQATGAHAIAYWEAQRLGAEVVFSLLFPFMLIGLVYWFGFRTLAGYGYVLLPLLLGMFWALGATGWILGRLNLMAAAFGAVLLGVGDDFGILIFSRYRDERRVGKSKHSALRAALLGTGPGVIAAALATAAAFLSCMAAPFPGFRDLGFTAGIGLLACLLSAFLLLPLLLMARDKGTGTFAISHPSRPIKIFTTETRRSRRVIQRKSIHLRRSLCTFRSLALRAHAVNPSKGRKARGLSSRRHFGGASSGGDRFPWRPLFVIALMVFALLGAFRLRWEEDLRRFRQAGNPALALQTSLGKVLGAGLQPLAVQIPLDGPELTARRWNRVAGALRKEGVPMPEWKQVDPSCRLVLGSRNWCSRALDIASKAGLDPALMERPLEALRAGVENPVHALRSLNGVMAGPRKVESANRDFSFRGKDMRGADVGAVAEHLTIPLRIPESVQDRLEPLMESADARLVGNRPLFKAVKSVAKTSLQDVLLIAFSAVMLILLVFGRNLRFMMLAMVPLVASQLGVLGVLGWTGEPLTFLSVVAIPIALGVSLDTAMNLLHRARQDASAIGKVARVNAVCAGTTLAGFGGLVFSSYRGLRGLGLACLGGTALALLASQWLLPWMMKKRPRSLKS